MLGQSRHQQIFVGNPRQSWEIYLQQTPTILFLSPAWLTLFVFYFLQHATLTNTHNGTNITQKAFGP